MPSIEEHCCGADQMFDQKTAEKQYKRFRMKGASRVTARLIEQLSQLERGTKLLDVGGGIGAIQWWFLSNGGNESWGVDASHAYTKIAQDHANEENWEDRSHFLIGNLSDVENEIPEVDHSSLDKVICCYPDYREILSICARKTHQSIHLSYPMDGIIADVFRSLGVLFMKMKGSDFRPFVHPVKDVRAYLEELGFENRSRDLTFPWHVETWVRRP